MVKEDKRGTENEMLSNFYKILFEFLGSAALGIFLTTVTDINFLFAFWWLVAFSANISGSHFNPAITLACVLRSGSASIHWALGLGYIVVQILGHIAGVSLAWLLMKTSIGNVVISDSNDYIQACVAETLGSLLFIFIFLTQTDSFTRFSNDLAIWSLVVAASYSSALSYASIRIARSLNPAYALALELTAFIDNKPGFTFKYAWVYLIFSFVGALIAIAFYEYVYKNALEECGEKEDNHNVPKEVSGQRKYNS